VGVIVAVLVAAAGLFIAMPAESPGPVPRVGPEFGSVEAVGRQLFTQTLVPFELATALLIVAVVGAISVARGRSQVKKADRKVLNPTQRLFGGPVKGPVTDGSLAKEEAR
jgi:NADH-quinone oxidoreductase subunit J